MTATMSMTTLVLKMAFALQTTVMMIAMVAMPMILVEVVAVAMLMHITAMKMGILVAMIIEI
jgi:hypothetical protein